MEFDFRQNLVVEAEIDEVAARSYIDELCQQFAESPEGSALVDRGIQPGHYLDMFLDYALRYLAVTPAKMDARDIRATLDVMAEKVSAEPEDFDQAIPELEAFCDFVRRAFLFEEAIAWKRAIREHAPQFRRAVRDPRQWGIAKSMVMEGMARGFDLSTEGGINLWFLTKQAEELARAESEEGLESGEGLSPQERVGRLIGSTADEDEEDAEDEYGGGIPIDDFGGDGSDIPMPEGGTVSKRKRQKAKSRRKQAKASRRRNRR